MFKEKAFYVGDKLIANCTTTRSKPHPHITWLINGKKVKRNKNVEHEKKTRKAWIIKAQSEAGTTHNGTREGLFMTTPDENECCESLN